MSPDIKITPLLYDSVYERRGRLALLTKLDNEVIGDDEINSLGCNGFLSKGDLARYELLLRQHLSGQSSAFDRRTLLDLGCGSGGLGRWLANQLDLNLIGIDFSRVAIEHASLALTKQERTRITYKVADFSGTGIENNSIAAIISLDALYLANDPIAALHEAYRVLISKGPLIFTLYIESPVRSQNSLERVQPDWPTMLRMCGFSVALSKDVTNIWRRQVWQKHKRRWTNQSLLRRKLGPLVEAELAVSAGMLGLYGKPSFLRSVSRFEVVATRES